MIKAILAVGENGEIGQEGDMPWKRRLPKDLEYFKKMTTGKIVVMGNTTYESIPFYPKGLPQRYNYVITSNGYGQQPSGVIKLTGSSFKKCLDLGESIFHHNKDTWLIGGGTIYLQFLKYVDEIHITRVKTTFPDADSYYPVDVFLDEFEKVGEDIDVSGDDLEAYVEIWRRKV